MRWIFTAVKKILHARTGLAARAKLFFFSSVCAVTGGGAQNHLRADRGVGAPEVTVQERIAPSGQPKSSTAPGRARRSAAFDGVATRRRSAHRADSRKYSACGRDGSSSTCAHIEGEPTGDPHPAVARGLLARRAARRRLAQPTFAPAPPPPPAAPQLHSPRPRPPAASAARRKRRCD